MHARFWFEQEDMSKNALQHKFPELDETRRITLIIQDSESLLLAGKYDQYLKLVDETSPELLVRSPIILVYQATAMLFSEHPRQAILDVLTKAEQLAPSDALDGEISAIRAIIQSYTCNPEKGIKLSQKALSKIDPQQHFFRNLVERNLGVAYTLKNDLRNANTWFENLLMSSYKLEDWGGVLASYNYLTFIRKVQGRLKDAAVIYKKALGFIEEKGLELMPHSIKIISGYGHLLLQWHRLDDAKAYFKRAIQLAKMTDILYAYTAYQNLSEAFVQENDIRSALAAIQELRHLAQGKQDFYHHIHTQRTLAVEAHIHLEAGRGERAYAWLLSSSFDRLSANELLSRFGLELGYIVPIAVRIYIDKGQHDRAIQTLEAIIPKFIHQGAHAFLISALNALAVAYHQIGRSDKAIKALTKAIVLAEPEDDLGDFLILGGHLIPLLNDAMSGGIAPDFIRQLLSILAKFKSSQKSPAHDLNNIDPLSRREMDVLGLIAEGMTNQEIAKKLFLSTNTIKSHSIKIYRKLNVNNRNQAVSKARLLGILPGRPPGAYGGFAHMQP
jgi:LuxR family maltose regulon positive regulatory protein